MKRHINRAPEIREKLFRRQSGLCAYCNQPMTLRKFKSGDRPNPADATIDHIVPRSEGGTHALANLVAACRQCNVRRGKGFCRLILIKERS